jgi:ferric-dicitrate binding protein FerR (iron transport regulator)
MASLNLRTRDPSRRLAHGISFWAVAAMFPFVSGCAVISVASTAVSVATSVASTAVDVGVGAVKVTGKVLGKGVDVMTGSGPSAPMAAASVPKAAAK